MVGEIALYILTQNLLNNDHFISLKIYSIIINHYYDCSTHTHTLSNFVFVFVAFMLRTRNERSTQISIAYPALLPVNMPRDGKQSNFVFVFVAVML